ncbi:probable splicing factor 3A subunit 1 [Eutrema salsugineum]|uniref:probable splicing factor 3A subunit 1 n=1 Tax=Eutrema salsugineum TaxID=72664 RepID=UPI000CECEBBF|nr:probable splicing factor 3A subunit 1 [Eutrema salsugineum]
MKLTALFVARYGMRFWWGLMKKVDKKPQFKFMEPSDGKFSVYNRILVAYEGVIWACDNVCTATVLGAFFRCLQLEMLEEGTETDMIDLHAFVSGVAWFGQVEDDDYSTFMPHPQLLSLMSNRLIPGSRLFYPYPSMGMMQPAPPMPGMSPHPPQEEPEPKRQKLQESALVPQDRFISQHPSHIFRVPLGSGGAGGIEITVQSLWEKSGKFEGENISEVVET